MTIKEIEHIQNDKTCILIKHDNGEIYMKKSLYEIRKKKIDKLFKYDNIEVNEIPYNQFFMKQVSLLLMKLRKRDERYKKAGYKKVYYDDGGYRFTPKDEDDENYI